MICVLKVLGEWIEDGFSVLVCGWLVAFRGWICWLSSRDLVEVERGLKILENG